MIPRLSFFFVAAFTLWTAAAWAQQPLPRIVILNSYHQGEDWSDNQLAGIVPTLQRKYPDLMPAVEHLDAKRYPGKAHRDLLEAFLSEKYRASKVDLVMVLDNPALLLLLDARRGLFPGVPIVFAGINGFHREMLGGETDITGVVEKQDMAGTLRLAMELQPGLKRVLAIHDYTSSGLAVRHDMEAVLPEFRDSLKVEFTPKVPFVELETRLRELPEDSAAVLLTYVTDPTGRVFSRAESTRLISQASAVPVYAMHETRLRHGIIGGMLLKGQEDGAQAARMALEILAGRKADSIPISQSTSQPVFDYNQLSRFKIGLDSLPPHSLVINQPPYFWERYRSIALPAILIIGLLWLWILMLSLGLWRLQKARNKLSLSERRLADNNQLLSGILEHTHMMVAFLDPDFRFIWVNRAYAENCGYETDFFPGKNHFALYPHEENQAIFKRVRDTGEPFFVQAKPFEFPDQPERGTTYWDWSLIPVKDGKGKVSGLVFTLAEVTERIRAEESLRKSEEHHRVILQTAVDGFWLADKEGRLLEVNEAYSRMSGYSKEELLAMSIPDFEASEAAQETRAHIKKVLFQGMERFESRHRRKDGSIFDVEVSVQHQPLAEGRLVAFIRDISERKRAEEALRESKLFLDNLTDIAYVSDDQGKVTWVNPAAEKITGLPRDEIIGKPFLPLFVEADHPSVLRVYERSLNGESLEHVLTLTSGVTCHFTSLPKRNHKGEVIGTFGIARDITDRLAMEQKLRESRANLSALIESSEDIIVSRNREGQVIVFNEGFAQVVRKVFNLEAQQDIGTRDYLPEIKGLNWKKIIEKVNLGESHREVFTRSFDDATRHFELSIRPIWSGQEIIGSAEFTRDITGKREAEQEKARMEFQLIQAHKMEAIGTLAGGIAHDFNNILAAIIGFTELSLEDVREDLPIRMNLEQINRSALRAKDLVRQILSFSRQTDQERKIIRLGPIVKETLRLLRATVPRMIEINQEVDPSLNPVEADPTQVHQLILNLGSNAADAMKTSGGTLTVKLENFPVDRALAESQVDLKEGNYIRFTFRDTGPGIPPEIIDRIFDPFFTTKEIGSGTGMGLSVVHGIVKSHGGAVMVESNPGEGASFLIYLPAAESTQVSFEQEPVGFMIKGTGRVLFVDDEESIATVARLMLTRLGYTPTVKTSGLEALETFKDGPDSFDLVITDMAMPQMTGIDLAKEILRVRPGVPLILCTGYSDQIDEAKARELGIGRLLMKPLSVSVVSQVIREVLDGRRPA